MRVWTLTFTVRAICVKTEFAVCRRSYSRKSNLLSTLAVSAGNERFLTLGGWILVKVLVHCSTFSKTIAVLAPKRKQKFVSRVYMQVYWSPFICIKYYVLPLSYARNEVLCCAEHLRLASSLSFALGMGMARGVATAYAWEWMLTSGTLTSTSFNIQMHSKVLLLTSMLFYSADMP